MYMCVYIEKLMVFGDPHLQPQWRSLMCISVSPEFFNIFSP